MSSAATQREEAEVDSNKARLFESSLSNVSFDSMSMTKELSPVYGGIRNPSGTRRRVTRPSFLGSCGRSPSLPARGTAAQGTGHERKENLLCRIPGYTGKHCSPRLDRKSGEGQLAHFDPASSRSPFPRNLEQSHLDLARVLEKTLLTAAVQFIRPSTYPSHSSIPRPLS